jgi:hypothetical protein
MSLYALYVPPLKASLRCKNCKPKPTPKIFPGAQDFATGKSTKPGNLQGICCVFFLLRVLKQIPAKMDYIRVFLDVVQHHLCKGGVFFVAPKNGSDM